MTTSTMRPGLDLSSGPALPSRPGPAQEEPEDSRSSSSTNSPAPPDNEESDFFNNNNDSQSSVGFPNFQDMAVDDACWPPVNRLPNEILMAVFSKLGTPADLFSSMLVCRRWARNAVDMLWHRPACTNWNNHEKICQTLGYEHPFFNYRDFIRRLNLANLADEVNDGSVQPLSVCTRVERLTLTNCRNLTDSGLVSLVDGSSSLLALDISNDKHITEKSVNAIAENCKRLQGLNISGCENISNESLITLAQNCRYIKRLKLNECVQIRDDAVHAFAEHCPNILEIDLYQCAQIGNGPITSLMVKGNCLRELRLSNCELIDDNAFLSISSNKIFEHLRILDLTSCARLTDAAVQKIVDVAPRLRNLVLQKCRLITDVSINAIARLGKNLHYVHLGHCGQITDEGVKRLVSHCNRIRYIDLGCCTNLTDESVKRLALLPKLKRIGLVKCSHITDESVNALAEAAFRRRLRRDAAGVLVPANSDPYASSLERVHLSYCINLTLKSILRLLNACPRLTHLSLTGVAAFQRDEFQPFCRQAPPEFTQHQRDVFCVFSGGMVSEFRNFLNRDSRFAELRERYPGDLRIRHMQPVYHSSGLTQRAAGQPADTFDDEMVDEDNDFEGADAAEGVDGADMIIDAHSNNQNIHQPNGHAHGAVSPVPPPPPMHFYNFGPQSGGETYETEPATEAGRRLMAGLEVPGFMQREHPAGSAPVAAHGHSLASLAALRPPRPNGTAGEASSAPVNPLRSTSHYDPDGGAPSTESDRAPL